VVNLFGVVKWYFRLSPYLNRLQQLLTMKLSTNVIAQFLALLIQAGNQFGGVIPAKFQPIVALLVGISQLVVGYMAHLSNTDGTPQAVAFQPKAGA
jgi:hypothetical protein